MKLRRTLAALAFLAVASWAPSALAAWPWGVEDSSPVNMGGSWSCVTATGTGSLATGSVVLHSVTVSQGAAGAFLELWDATSTAGATISVLTASNSQPVTVVYDARLSHGLSYLASASSTAAPANFLLDWQDR